MACETVLGVHIPAERKFLGPIGPREMLILSPSLLLSLFVLLAVADVSLTFRFFIALVLISLSAFIALVPIRGYHIEHLILAEIQYQTSPKFYTHQTAVGVEFVGNAPVFESPPAPPPASPRRTRPTLDLSHLSIPSIKDFGTLLSSSLLVLIFVYALLTLFSAYMTYVSQPGRQPGLVQILELWLYQFR